MVATTTLIIMMAISAAITAASQMAAAKQQQKMLNYQAEVKEQQAQREREIAIMKARDLKRESSAHQARRRLVLSSRGGDSPGRSESLVVDTLDADAEYKAALLEAGGEDRATRLEQEATGLMFAGENAKTAGYWQAAGSLARGGSAIASGIGGGGGGSYTTQGTGYSNYASYSGGGGGPYSSSGY